MKSPIERIEILDLIESATSSQATNDPRCEGLQEAWLGLGLLLEAAEKRSHEDELVERIVGRIESLACEALARESPAAEPKSERARKPTRSRAQRATLTPKKTPKLKRRLRVSKTAWAAALLFASWCWTGPGDAAVESEDRIASHVATWSPDHAAAVISPFEINQWYDDLDLEIAYAQFAVYVCSVRCESAIDAFETTQRRLDHLENSFASNSF